MSSSAEIHQETCPKCESNFMIVCEVWYHNDGEHYVDYFCPDCEYEIRKTLEEENEAGKT